MVVSDVGGDGGDCDGVGDVVMMVVAVMAMVVVAVVVVAVAMVV